MTSTVRRVWVALAFVPTVVAGQDACQVLRLTEIQRLGSVDGQDAFTSIWDLDLDANGSIYVTDRIEPGVQVFDPQGRLIRRIGRRGEGPGEFFRSTPALGWVDDTLWVGDQSGLHYFDGSGREIRRVAFRRPFPEHGSALVPGYPLSDGSVLGRRILTGAIDRFRLAESLPLLRLSTTGSVLDTIVHVRRAPMVLGERNRLGVPDPMFEHPLYDWTGDSGLPVVVAVDGASVVVVDDRRDGDVGVFDLHRVSIAGDTVVSRRIDYERRRITASDRAFISDAAGRHHAGAFIGSRGPSYTATQEARIRERVSSSIEFAEYHPPVRKVFAGHDGTVWLLRETAPLDVDRWEVYGSDLELIGAVEISDGRMSPIPWFPRLWPLRATSDELWGYTIDDLAVPYIHRFRIDRVCEG